MAKLLSGDELGIILCEVMGLDSTKADAVRLISRANDVLSVQVEMFPTRGQLRRMAELILARIPEDV